MINTFKLVINCFIILAILSQICLCAINSDNRNNNLLSSLLLSRKTRESNANALLKRLNIGIDNREQQMAMCTDRFNCEQFCRKVVNGWQYNTDAHFGKAITGAHKLGLKLGRKNNCDKCAMFYPNCDQNNLMFASKFWGSTNDNMFVEPEERRY